MIRNLLCIISDWKQSALRFLTRPRLGQSAMGLSARLLARWRNTRYLYFYDSSFIYDVERWTRERLFFSCPNCTWSIRWYGMLYLLLNRLILPCSFLTAPPPPPFFFPFTLFTSLYSHSFFSTCTRYLLLPPRHVPGLRQPKLICNYIGVRTRFVRARVVYPGPNGRWGLQTLQPIQTDFGRNFGKGGVLIRDKNKSYSNIYTIIIQFILWRLAASQLGYVSYVVFEATCRNPEFEKGLQFQVLCTAWHCQICNSYIWICKRKKRKCDQ